MFEPLSKDGIYPCVHVYKSLSINVICIYVYTVYTVFSSLITIENSHIIKAIIHWGRKRLLKVCKTQNLNYTCLSEEKDSIDP